ncbi:hypothetical protein DXG03_005093, partial [Asterophora parasitica]
MSFHGTSVELPIPPAKSERPFSKSFFDADIAVERATYLKILFGGTFSIIIVIFAVFPIFWGALWKTPIRNLDGWVVDFDGGLIGQTVTQALTSAQASHLGKVTWTAVSATQFAGGLIDLAGDVKEQRTWVAIASILDGITKTFARQAMAQLVSSPNLIAISRESPQTVLAPLGYTFDNLAPFDKPVATAVTFVGLIYQLILSFFIVMISTAAREESGLGRTLTLRSIILTRFASSFGGYFFVSLFYALLSLAFQLDFTRKFGHGGFVVFWMLNWAGMLSVGLALESLLTLLTVRFIPYFMILWIIINVSVCVFPIEVMPIFFRYGYAMPFFNVSQAVRTIVFGTRNRVGENFGILIAWIIISCISLPLIQWFVRRREIAAASALSSAGKDEKEKDEEKR